jgi:hypothetical protein
MLVKLIIHIFPHYYNFEFSILPLNLEILFNY